MSWCSNIVRTISSELKSVRQPINPPISPLPSHGPQLHLHHPPPLTQRYDRSIGRVKHVENLPTSHTPLTAMNIDRLKRTCLSAAFSTFANLVKVVYWTACENDAELCIPASPDYPRGSVNGLVLRLTVWPSDHQLQKFSRIPNRCCASFFRRTTYIRSCTDRSFQ